MELGFLFHIPQIIEGSARVAGLTVEETLVQQARDPETDDALPLLAFTLHGLLEWPSNKSLTLDGCKALGDEKAGLTRSKTRCAGRRQGAGRGEVDR